MIVPYVSKNKTFYVDFEKKKITVGDVELDFSEIFAMLALILNERLIRFEIEKVSEP